MRRLRLFGIGAAAFLAASAATGTAHGFTIGNSCNGTPYGFWIPSATTFYYESTCSMIPAAQEAADNAFSKLWAVQTSSIMTPAHYYNDCAVYLDNDRSEVARVPAATIDGNNGLTFPFGTPCVLSASYTEHDVLVASELELDRPQDAWIGNNFSCRSSSVAQQNGACDIGLAHLTFLHEFGHAWGLGETTHAGPAGQCVMRSPASSPYGGSTAGQADPTMYFPDDLIGFEWEFGNVASVRNVVSSDTHLVAPGTDSLVGNSGITGFGIPPQGWGVVFNICPNSTVLTVYSTSINVGTTTETFQRRLFLTPSPWDANINNGWLLNNLGSMTLGPNAIGVSQYALLAPSTLPRNQWLWMFHQVDPTGAVPGRDVDNISQYGFVVNVLSPSSCNGQ